MTQRKKSIKRSPTRREIRGEKKGKNRKLTDEAGARKTGGELTEEKKTHQRVFQWNQGTSPGLRFIRQRSMGKREEILETCQMYLGKKELKQKKGDGVVGTERNLSKKGREWIFGLFMVMLNRQRE